MGNLSEFAIIKSADRNDFLRIDDVNKKIRAKLSATKFIDRDTNQFVIFVPSINISSYGKTEAKAQEMMKNAISDFFDYLVSHKGVKRNRYLIDLGWKKDKFSRKEFSRAFVDGNGELRNFNVQKNSIERIEVIA
jgi:predicted RNase H-like HicB family nuclease